MAPKKKTTAKKKSTAKKKTAPKKTTAKKTTRKKPGPKKGATKKKQTKKAPVTKPKKATTRKKPGPKKGPVPKGYKILKKDQNALEKYFAKLTKANDALGFELAEIGYYAKAANVIQAVKQIAEMEKMLKEGRKLVRAVQKNLKPIY